VVDLRDPVANDNQVMPLIFIILLENAFKYGVQNLKENAFVYIPLSTKYNEIHFDIENNFEPTQDQQYQGIGLKKFKLRLGLAYAGRNTF